MSDIKTKPQLRSQISAIKRGGFNPTDLEIILLSIVDSVENTVFKNVQSVSNVTVLDWEKDTIGRWIMTIAENTTFTYWNHENRGEGIIVLTVSGATRTITMPTTTKMSSSTVGAIVDASWTTGSKALVLPAGTYKLGIHFDGTSDLVDIAGGDYS